MAASLWSSFFFNQREKLSAGLLFDSRYYAKAQALLDYEIDAPTLYADANRYDLHPSFGLRFVSARQLFLSGAYLLGYNDSNSLGETYLRQRLQLVSATQLPFDVFVSLTAALQITRYPSGLALSQRLLLEDGDESQNKLVLTLRRPILDRISLEFRIGSYSNEPSQSGIAFHRLTTYLGLRFDG